jgi:hypothetical protein
MFELLYYPAYRGPYIACNIPRMLRPFFTSPARLVPDDDGIRCIILMLRTTGVGNLINTIKYLRNKEKFCW